MAPDELYGPCLPPGRNVEPLETRFSPKSLQRLDRVSAPYLDMYFKSAAGLSLQHVVHQQATLLWILDDACDIYFAQEELIMPDSGEYLIPYFRSNKILTLVPEGKIGRLGHPSLLTGKKNARIGGEIMFTPESQNLWTLNRRSGRYGRRSHQTVEHLLAAHQLFSSFGLQIDVEAF